MRPFVKAFAALALVLAAIGLARADSLVIPSFVDETASAGVDSVFTGQWQYMVGGGVATFDCNADGFPDMLLAGGEKPAKFYLNQSPRGGVLKFKEQQSGLELDAVTGAYPLDVDSDGITDIVELRVGEAVVMRGLGGCKFERANETWAFDGGDAWWTAFSATFEHASKWPTLALGSYIDRTQDIEPWGTCTDNWLERPNADGTGFAEPLALKPSYCPLSMLFTDWNRSGTQALRVSNDREYYVGGTEQLWHVDPGKAPALYTAKEGWKPLKIWGMGIATADINGDGLPDYFLTSMADNKLQTLTTPAPTSGVRMAEFKDVAFPLNAIAQHPYTGGDVNPSTAWHAQFEDVNNDCRPDLFIAKGNVTAMPDFAMKDPDNLLLQGADGKFVEVGDKAGVDSMQTGRGAGLPDFNLDGLPDLVVVNRNNEAQVWRNTTADAGHWLDLKLSQDGTNRDAIGAWITVKAGDITMTREITVGGGHASGQDTWIHFGLAAMTEAAVTVTWPDGSKSDPMQLAGDGFYVLSPGQAAKGWSPA
ncbi:MAG: CRTAC1 family protein [Devosia sp.]